MLSDSDSSHTDSTLYKYSPINKTSEDEQTKFGRVSPQNFGVGIVGLRKSSLQRQRGNYSWTTNHFRKRNCDDGQEGSGKKKQKKRRSTPLSRQQKKPKYDLEIVMKQAQEETEGHELIALNSALLIIWTPNILETFQQIFQRVLIQAMKEKQYEAKKYIQMLMEILSYCQKTLLQQKSASDTCSPKELVAVVLNSEWSTIFLDRQITLDTLDWITQNYVDNLPGPFSSSRTIKNTSTSSMIVPIQTDHADVDFLKSSNIKSIEDSLEESFRVGSTRSNIGYIPQSILKRTNDTICTWTSPGERGYQVVKLDVFDYGRICKKPKDQWWREANYRSTFVIQSPADKKYMLLMKLLLSVSKTIQETEGSKKEEREMKSSFS